MFKITIITFIFFNIFLSQSFPQEVISNTVICLYELSIPPASNLDFMKSAIKDLIINRLTYTLPEIRIHFDNDIIKEYLKEPEKILNADKVQLLQIRRETGFDGLIFGDIDQQQNDLIINLYFLDLSSGFIYSTGKLQGSFGSTLIKQIEEKIDLFSNSLKSYYNCVLDITSEPADAEVWINSVKAGNTPLTDFNVRYGQASLEIKKQNYIPYKTNVELRPGQRFMIHALLNKYSLSATSNPDNAYVLVNGQVMGTTPIKDIPIDQPDFTIEFAKNGFAGYKESISLTPGQQAYVHASLYDLLNYNIKNRNSIWEISAHNFCLNQTLNIQDLSKINVSAFPVSNFKYYAKFNRFSTGFGLGVGYINAANYFETFLGPKEGYEEFTVEIIRGSVFAQYNIIERLNKLEVYLATFTGFSSTTSNISYPTYYYYETYVPSDYTEIKKLNPLLGGEFGINTYISRVVKISVSAGSYYAGDLEYAVKKASYWGTAKYERERITLRPFYIGLSVTLSIWPSLL